MTPPRAGEPVRHHAVELGDLASPEHPPTLALVYGLFSLSFGVCQIVLGSQLRHDLNILDPRVQHA